MCLEAAADRFGVARLGCRGRGHATGNEPLPGGASRKSDGGRLDGRRLFGDMSVRENLRVAGEHGRRGRWDLAAVLIHNPGIPPAEHFGFADWWDGLDFQLDWAQRLGWRIASGISGTVSLAAGLKTKKGTFCFLGA